MCGCGCSRTTWGRPTTWAIVVRKSSLRRCRSLAIWHATPNVFCARLVRTDFGSSSYRRANACGEALAARGVGSSATSSLHKYLTTLCKCRPRTFLAHAWAAALLAVRRPRMADARKMWIAFLPNPSLVVPPHETFFGAHIPHLRLRHGAGRDADRTGFIGTLASAAACNSARSVRARTGHHLPATYQLV